MAEVRWDLIPWVVAGALLLAARDLGAQTESVILALPEAERLALAQDPGIARFHAQADALTERAVADGQLPDPEFRFALLNFPSDTFNRTQEPMTQVQLGVQQRFARGNSLAVNKHRTEALSSAERDRAGDQARKTVRDLRLSWLDLFYWLSAEQIVQQNKGLFGQLVEVTQYQYAVGRQNQQDVIGAQLELSLLDDRLEQIRTQQDKSRADLSRWIGVQSARRPLPAELPRLPIPPDRETLASRLKDHPLIKAAQASVSASQQSVALAREAYKPGWTLGIAYGFRGGENPDGDDRADFLTAMLTVDLPIFREKRQDRTLAASQHEVQAAMLARDERLRELRQLLDARHAEWERLDQRITLYDTTLLPQANNNAAAALLAYQNDMGEFAQLMRARIMELDTQLKALRIRVDHTKAQAHVLYLAGDER